VDRRGRGGERKEGNDAWNLQTSNRAEQQTAKQNTRGNGPLLARSVAETIHLPIKQYIFTKKKKFKFSALTYPVQVVSSRPFESPPPYCLAILYPHLVADKTLSNSGDNIPSIYTNLRLPEYKVRMIFERWSWRIFNGLFRGEFRPRQTRQLPRAVDLKGRLLSFQSY